MTRSPISLPPTDPALTVEAGQATAAIDPAANPQLTAALDAMADEWASGRRRPAEEWLAEHPELQADPKLAVRLVYEELCLREDRGEAVTSTEFYQRFPQWRDDLAMLLKVHRFLSPDRKPGALPQAGQSLGELCLLEELGRGALGRVYLATQPSLSDRSLVVKVSARRGQEHLSLARLQHTNIVPLYLVQDFPQEDLRALCMPYLGGASWHAILEGLKEAPANRSGAQIVEQLTRARRPEDAAWSSGGPSLGFLTRASYVESVCWIGACLADALHYAHQRGLAHLDVKPSNVLIAADGQPMLLDFHLASEIQRLRESEFRGMGGTPNYMSPEQRAAMDAIRRGGPLPQPIDGRSDVYSLGVVLYESLAGQLPPSDAAQSRAALRKANPAVSRGVEDIAHKCLAPQPDARYRDAGELAIDLRRHLANLPLRSVPNRSLLERWQKWRRRRPYAMPIAAAAGAALLVVGLAFGLVYRERVREARSLLGQSIHELESRQFTSSVDHARRGLQTIQWFPWQTEVQQRLETQLATARRAAAVGGVHELVDRLRFLDDQPLGRQALESIAAGCDKIWKSRQSLLAPAQAAAENAKDTAPERDTAPEDDELKRDLVDLAIFDARIKTRLAPEGEIPAAFEAARGLIAEARATCGDSFLLDLEQRDYEHPPANGVAGATDRSATADALPVANTAWEHCGLGRWLMHHGDYAHAEPQLIAAVDLQPGEFWAHFQLARCRFDLGQLEPALESAEICVALAPGRAECFYNRGLCHQKLGHDAAALADFSRALKLSPQLALALLARGVLYGQLKKFTNADDDLNAALTAGANPSEVHYQLARLSLAQGDSVAARRWLSQALADDPSNSAALALERQAP